MKDKLIPFTKEDVKAYLDRCIVYWRDKDPQWSEYYVDAFQSVRMTLFGETLDEEIVD